MHFLKKFLKRSLSSSLIPSDLFKPVCCGSPSPGDTHSETDMVGGDAVATGRFLGNNPSPPSYQGSRVGSPVIF
jgi:hypothetical protein